MSRPSKSKWPSASLYPPNPPSFPPSLKYLNPDWDDANGGEIRLWGHDGAGGETCEDIPPSGDRLLLFWSDQVVHEVLPCWDESEVGRRFALTLWLVSENTDLIGGAQDHPLRSIREGHF